MKFLKISEYWRFLRLNIEFKAQLFPKEMQRLTRCLFQIKGKFHFTSYWRYCFLHSGVIWDERCSANFILPEQLCHKSSDRSESRCPLPRRRDFCYFSQLGWINMRCVSAAHSASSSLHFWLVPDSALRADPVPHTIWARSCTFQWPLSCGCRVSGVTGPVPLPQWLCFVSPWARLRTLRSAIALSHSDVVASAERAVLVWCWDL